MATAGILSKEEEYHATFRKLLEEVTKTLEHEHAVVINEAFAVMMVKLVSLDAENKFLIRQPIVRSELERLKKIVIERVMSMPPITRNIIRMQLHYKSNYHHRQELIEAHRFELEEQIKPFIIDMTTEIPKHLRHYDLFYQKLIAATIIRAGMGQPNEYLIVKQTEDALNSVFPKDDINLLSSMTPKEREVELRHLMKMTTGIRLYNKELDSNTGFGIPDLIGMLPKRISDSLEFLDKLRKRNIKRLIMYTTLTQPYFLSHYQMTKVGRRGVSQHMVWIRQGLVMIHQILICLKELTDELTIEKQICAELIDHHTACIKDLTDTVQGSETVPTFVVYPKFVELANSWERIQGSLSYAETCSDLIQALKEFTEKDLHEIDPLVARTLVMSKTKLPPEEEFFHFPEHTLTDDHYALARRASFSFDMDPLNTEYSGFCVWSLVRGLGLVLLSNPNLGVFLWHGREYLVSTPEAAEEFRRDPDSFIYKAVHIARRWPELIFLLNVGDEAFSPEYVKEADRARSAVHALISKDVEVQTDTHPYDSNIVPGYSWNEWDYRRKALILSKVHKCSTHSTQTHWQALKKSQKVQTYPIKNTRTQTDRDEYAEAPRSQFWFYGLRGLHQHPPHIVELTREAVMEMPIKFATKQNRGQFLPT